MSEVLRDETFFYCTGKNFRGVESRVILTSSSIVIKEANNAKKEHQVLIEDVIGCLCMKNPDANDSQQQSNGDANSVFLCVYFYPLCKNFKNDVYRKRETALLRCCKYSSFVENCDLISKYEFATKSLFNAKFFIYLFTFV